jgi:hypothetical protein
MCGKSPGRQIRFVSAVLRTAARPQVPRLQREL